MAFLALFFFFWYDLYELRKWNVGDVGQSFGRKLLENLMMFKLKFSKKKKKKIETQKLCVAQSKIAQSNIHATAA